MAVRAPIEQTEGLYFITFTCCQWCKELLWRKGFDWVILY